MKIKHIWSVLCKESIINQDDNIISLNGVLEELTVTVTPINDSNKLPEKIGIPINYEVVSMWVKEKKISKAKAEIEYILVSPEGTELLKTVQNMEIPISSNRFRSRMKISGFPITREGEYSLKISVKEEGEKNFEQVSNLPLEVIIKLEKPQIKK